MAGRLDALVPRPQKVVPSGASRRFAGGARLHCAAGVDDRERLLRRVEEALVGVGFDLDGGRTTGPGGEGRALHVRLALRRPPAPRPQAYRLRVGDDGVEIVGTDAPGLFYGVVTFAQLVGLHGAPGRGEIVLPTVLIEDWPEFVHRGVMLDVSRDKVPTMATLQGLVERLAGWKLNQLQLYFEHTFAYPGHEVVWREASPFTADEVRTLDAFCRARHVELVPNQNSFGHMHRWLVHEPYRRLAECPEGIDHPFSPRREPYGLCPTDPGSLALLAELYDTLLPHFRSRLFNVGLDETIDLGRGRSAAQCRARGEGRVYLDFLRAVHRLATERGRRVQFWADIVLQHPELVAELPRDAIALLWGYEASHPFAEQAHAVASAGLELYVCPGTSAWNSFLGRTTNMRANVAAAVRAGRDAGASGVLVTDWGDHGHLQPLPVSYPGLLLAAALSWNAAAAAAPDRIELARLLDLHVLRDETGGTGAALLELGDVYRAAGVEPWNASALFELLLFPALPVPRPRLDGISPTTLRDAAAAIDEALSRLANGRMGRADAELVERELRWAAALARCGARLGAARLRYAAGEPVAALPAPVRQRLAAELAPLVDEHRPLWLARNREGGRRDSVARLEAVLVELGGRS